MEELKPSQLILLNILVTFVTSIATTVVSLSLLADTPLSITQVVNRVVETERVDMESLEGLRTELVQMVNERTATPQPEVAGAQEASAEIVYDLVASIPQPNDDGQIVLGSGITLAYTIEAASDEQTTHHTGEMYILLGSEFSGEFAFSQPEDGEDLFAVDPMNGELSLVEETNSATKEQTDSGLVTHLVETDACRQAGSWLITAKGQTTAVCTAPGLALQGVSIPLEASQDLTTSGSTQTPSAR